jgi:hypothetical protein
MFLFYMPEGVLTLLRSEVSEPDKKHRFATASTFYTHSQTMEDENNARSAKLYRNWIARRREKAKAAHNVIR